MAGRRQVWYAFSEYVGGERGEIARRVSGFCADGEPGWMMSILDLNVEFS